MDRGFTIIETLLFVSISGLLVMMVLAGFSSSLEAKRRIDTNRSFEASIEAEYTRVRTGTVVRQVDASGKVPRCTPSGTDSFPGASDDCVVIGKLLKLKQGANSSVSSYNVVANVTPTSTCTLKGIRAVIKCYDARVMNMSTPTATFAPEWQADIVHVSFQSKINDNDYRSYDSSQVAYIAVLRDPTSELVYIAPLNRYNDLSTGRYDLTDDDSLSNFENAKGQVCLKHEGLLAPKSYLRFNGGEGIGSIDMLPTPLYSGSGVPTCT